MWPRSLWPIASAPDHPVEDRAGDDEDPGGSCQVRTHWDTWFRRGYWEMQDLTPYRADTWGGKGQKGWEETVLSSPPLLDRPKLQQLLRPMWGCPIGWEVSCSCRKEGLAWKCVSLHFISCLHLSPLSSLTLTALACTHLDSVNICFRLSLYFPGNPV